MHDLPLLCLAAAAVGATPEGQEGAAMVVTTKYMKAAVITQPVTTPEGWTLHPPSLIYK